MVLRRSLLVLRACLIPSLLFGGCIVMPMNANAQDAQPGSAGVAEEQVERNALPEVEAYPMHVGPFEVLPKLSVITQYITNIFAEQTNEDNDIVTTVQPELHVKKRYRDHEFNVSGVASVARYMDHDDENVENYNGAFYGLLTATSRLKLPFNVSYKVDHQLRNQERTLLGTKEPARYRSFRTEVGAEYRPNRFFWHNYARYEQRRYDNVAAVNGGTIVREDGDFDSMELETRIGYETTTQWSPFIGLTVGQNDYLRKTYTVNAFNGPERDNDYYTVLGGVGFNYKGLLIGELGVGRTLARYDDPSIEDIATTAISGNAKWQFLERAILSGELSRKVEEDNFLNTGIVETKGVVGLEYELDRDLFLNSFVSLEHDEFDVGTREDVIYTGNIGVYYIISPRLQLDAGITYRSRDSNVIGASYDQSAIMVGVTGSL